MNAREILNELLHLQEVVRYGQGQARMDKQDRIAELIEQLYEVADDWDNELNFVPLCPDRDDPFHYKVECYICDHEGMRMTGLKQLKMFEEHA